MKNSGLKFLFILLFCLSSIQFFKPVAVPAGALFYAYCGLLLLTFLYVLTNYQSPHFGYFKFPVLLVLISILISGMAATYSWEQTLTESIKALLPYLSYILFFLLLVSDLTILATEKLMIILGLLFIVVYGITFFMYPTPVFGNTESFTDERGFQRIPLTGAGFLFLLSFYSLSRYILLRRLMWLMIYLLTLTCIVMTLTRTYIAFSFLFSLLYMIHTSNFLTKVKAMMIIGLCVCMITQMSFFHLLVEETKSEAADKGNNIRILSANYYLNNFSPNTINRIFGNGQPYKETKYFDFVQIKEKFYGLYISDIGYIGLYVKFGILSILAYVLLIYRTIRITVPEELLYCKYFLYFVFLISIIIDAPFNNSFIPAIVLSLYALSKGSDAFVYKT